MNQNSVENLFSSLREPSAVKTNPTCLHSTAALKAVIINKLVLTGGAARNCQVDSSVPLDDLLHLMRFAYNIKEVEKLERHQYILIL